MNAYDQLAHIRLTKKQRMVIASKLAQNISIDQVLRDIRDSFNGELHRIHITTKRNLHNILSSHGLCRPERFHKDDATGVDAFIRSYLDKPQNPFILYKRQGCEIFEFGCEDWKLPKCDILIGFMDPLHC